MRDVAALANVSVATVSAVVNGKGGVSRKLTERVRRALVALDYHPNQIARSLRVRYSHTIGMIIPRFTSLFFIEVIRGVENRARAEGYSVFLCESNEDPNYEAEHLNTLYSRRVDGVLLAPTASMSLGDYLDQRRFPIVLFDRIVQGINLPAVVTDNFTASHEATKHLIALGHEKIAIITGKLDLSTGQDRVQGFRKALQEAHVPVRDEYFQQGDFYFESGYRAGLALMKLPDPPTAIFSCGNEITLGLMRSLAELGIACPQQVSVVSFDDFSWSTSFSPTLTAVAQPGYEMGDKAMKLLLQRIRLKEESSTSFTAKRRKQAPRRLVVKAQLKIRGSTAPPKCRGSYIGKQPSQRTVRKRPS